MNSITENTKESDDLSGADDEKSIIKGLSMAESKMEPMEKAQKYPIGKLELGLYWAVWISHAGMAFALAANASRKAGHWLDHWLEPSSYSSSLRMDNSDIELKLFRLSVLRLVAVFILHSILFHFVRHLKIGPNARSAVLIGIWSALHIYLASFRCLLIILAIGSAIMAISRFSKCQFFAWAICLLLITKLNEWAPFSPDPANYFREFNMYLYCSIKVINLSIFLVQNDQIQIDRTLILQFLEYFLYSPYSTSLIVLFEDFQLQSKHDTNNNNAQLDRQKIKLLIWRAFRLIFWYFVLDLLLHLCCVNAFFNSPFTMLKHFNNYEVSSIAYVAGQLFHLKYLLIFGIPSLFASIDGFQPPGPPICIARVSKYSQMWRYFDRGLYAFLKTQVYIPLMRFSHPNTSPPVADSSSRPFSVSLFLYLLAPLGPLLSVFLFVLLWHGLSSQYLAWVSLSALELCIERVGRQLIWPNLQRRIQNGQLSVTNFIRLEAASMLFTVIPGIFGVFFFLSLPGVGSHIFGTVLLDGLLDIITLRVHCFNSGFVLLHLFLLGYCFNHVCLYIEHQEKEHVEEEKKKKM